MTEFRNDGGAVERRFNPASAEFRPELRSVAGSSAPHIMGYGAVIGKLSRNLGGFVEQVDRQAFRSSQAQGFPDVVCRYNHSDDWLLGTTKAGTCILSVDGTGLHYDVEVPETTRGNDVAVLARRGDITSSSFAFRVPEDGDYWERSSSVGGLPLRTLMNIELVDVAPVNTPAYPDATAFVRSFAYGAAESLARQFDASPEEMRNLMEQGKLVSLFKRSDRPAISPTTQEDEMGESRAKISTASKNDLPDSAFAYIEPGGSKDESGKTTPRSKRHFPIHDAAHVRNALARIGQGAQFGKEALAKVKAAAKKFGIGTDDKRELEDVELILRAMAEEADLRGLLFDADDEERAKGDLPPWLQKKQDDSEDEEDEKPSKRDDAAESEERDSSKNEDQEKEDDGSEVGSDNASDTDSEKPAGSKRAADDDSEERSEPGQPESEQDKEDDDAEKEEADEEVNQKMADLENKRRLMELMEKRYDPWFFDGE